MARSGKRGSSLSSRSNCLCPCNCGGDEKSNRQFQANSSKQSSSAGQIVPVSKNNKISVCDQEIQTEEIIDEQFLLTSLKKCTSNEVQSLILKDNISEVDEDNLSHNFQNVDINRNSSHHNGLNSNRLQTSRSTATIMSTESKGNRNIKLPKYLQREKMEKEEQRLREELRDPNCPPNHYAISEEERNSLLKTAEKSK